MLQFVLGVPGSAPPVDSSAWRGLRVRWIGWDGSVWDLTDPAGGVVLERAGVEGLGFPRIAKRKSSSSVIPGDRLRGWRTETRQVFWPLVLWADGSDAWLDLNEAFLRTIHPDRPGRWEVTGRETRTLRVTGVFEDGQSYEADPLQSGWAVYGIAGEAVQPYWEGAPLVAGPWQAPGAVNFIPPGGGPPFYISSSTAFGSARVSNRGDVEVSPTWVLDGPLVNPVVGVGTRRIEVPFDVAEGTTVQINTDPRGPSAWAGPTPPAPTDEEPDPVFVPTTDMTEDLGLQDFAPIPAGESVDLYVMATGSGKVSARFVPLYFRAM